MKLAMRLPEKAAAARDRDPREEATTEVIDLASRTSYPAVANRGIRPTRRVRRRIWTTR